MATTSDGVVCNRKRKHEQHDGCSMPNIIPLDVEKDAVTIGRLKDATVHLQCSRIPSMISRKHASIVHNRLKRKWLIKDHKVIFADQVITFDLTICVRTHMAEL